MVVAVDVYKIAYMPLPKAACTSVKTLLSWVEGGLEMHETGRDTVQANFQTRRFRLDRWEAYGDDWFKFCVIRDPFERLMSCYLDLVVTRNELANSRRLPLLHNELPAQPDPDFFFQHLQDYRRISTSIKHHSFHAEVFLGDDLSVYDVVYPTTELTELSRALSKRCQRRLIFPRENATRQRLTPDDLAPETQACIARWLAPDYALLGAYYTSPFEGEGGDHQFRGKVA